MESRRKGSQRSSAPKRKGARTRESFEEEVPMRMRLEGERRSKTRQDLGRKDKAWELTPPPKRRRVDVEVLSSPLALASNAEESEGALPSQDWRFGFLSFRCIGEVFGCRM